MKHEPKFREIWRKNPNHKSLVDCWQIRKGQRPQLVWTGIIGRENGKKIVMLPLVAAGKCGKYKAARILSPAEVCAVVMAGTLRGAAKAPRILQPTEVRKAMAKTLGKMAAGKPKNFSPAELARRKKRLVEARKKRWPRSGAVAPATQKTN